MSYNTYTKANLAAYSGRSEDTYTSYANQALIQALLLFKLATCLASPDDLSDDQKQLVDFGILSMADAIFLNQEHQAAVASPFSSESIGSYSYSKAARAVTKGESTGIMWFDMAVNQLGVCDFGTNGDIAFGGIELFENDGHLVQGSSGQNLRWLSPAEISSSQSFGFDPSDSLG